MYRIRIPIGIGLLALMAGLVCIDFYTKSCYATSLVIMALILGALWEFYQIMAKRQYIPYTILAMGCAFVGLLLYVFSRTALGMPGLITTYEIWIVLLILMSTLFNANQENVLESTFCTLFGLLYLYFPLSYLLKIRMLGLDNSYGLIYLFFTVLVAKSMDIGGYLAGKAFGKHKLFPSVSPKKSWEGFFGGLILTIAVTFAFMHFSRVIALVFTWPTALFYAVIMGILSIWGDFSESLVKRRCQVKDSSSLIPEFGGILDMMDSLIFTAPFSYYCLLLLKIHY